jgi:antitoxin MazE
MLAKFSPFDPNEYQTRKEGCFGIENVDTFVYTFSWRVIFMRAQLTRWGNSVAIRVPKRILDQAQLSEGDLLDLAVSEPGSISVKRAHTKPSLEDMLAAITPENLHDETDWGPVVGKEIW